MTLSWAVRVPFSFRSGPSSCNAKLNKPSKLYAIIVVRRKLHQVLLNLSVVTALVALYAPTAHTYDSLSFSLSHSLHSALFLFPLLSLSLSLRENERKKSNQTCSATINSNCSLYIPSNNRSATTSSTVSLSLSLFLLFLTSGRHGNQRTISQLRLRKSNRNKRKR